MTDDRPRHISYQPPHNPDSTPAMKIYICVFLVGMISAVYSASMSCVNTPFDIVVAFEDGSNVGAAGLQEFKDTLKSLTAQLDIAGGTHRASVIKYSSAGPTTVFELDDFTTQAAIDAAIDAAANDASAGEPDTESAVAEIKVQIDAHPKVGVDKKGVIIAVTPIAAGDEGDLDTTATTNFNDGIEMFAVATGTPAATAMDRQVSLIVHSPPVVRHTRALRPRDLNEFHDDTIEIALLRLLCPGDLGGSCGAATMCTAAMSECDFGTCKCMEMYQNEAGVCVEGGGLGDACNEGECSVASAVCEFHVCVCGDGYVQSGSRCMRSSDEELNISLRKSIAAATLAALPWILTMTSLRNPSQLALVAKRR